MNQIEKLYSDIFKITLNIQERYPALYELLSEMPETIPIIKNPEINFEILNSYYNSLRIILENHISNEQLSKSK